MEPYEDPDSKYPIDLVDLASEPPEIQQVEMEKWFRAHYEDPGERTPYESAEGGYQYIWGGPYEADEELYGKFSGFVPSELIDQLVSDLQNECMEWATTESDDDYEQFYVASAILSSEHRKAFEWSIVEVRALLDAHLSKELEDFVLRLLYANVITALETYLSDAFISTVVGYTRYMGRFIEMHEPFTQQKVKVSDVLKKARGMVDEAKREMAQISFHNLMKVEKLFGSILDVKFPADYDAIKAAIRKRHDLIHRNGFTVERRRHQLNAEDVRSLVRSVEEFVAEVDVELQRVREPEGEGEGEGEG